MQLSLMSVSLFHTLAFDPICCRFSLCSPFLSLLSLSLQPDPDSVTFLSFKRETFLRSVTRFLEVVVKSCYINKIEVNSILNVYMAVVTESEAYYSYNK